MRHIYRKLLLICVMAILGACGQAQVVPPTALVLPTSAPTATAAPTSTPAAVTNETLEQSRPATLRIVNAVPDSPPLNVFAGVSAIATNLAYTQFTEPTSFDAGKYTIKIQKSGSAFGDPSLLEKDLEFVSGDPIMVLISGTSDKLALTVLPDKSEALKQVESIIHVVNGLTDGGTVGLKNGANDLAAGVKVGQMVLSPILAGGKTDLTFQIGDQTLDYPADLQTQTNTTLIVVGTAAAAKIIQFDTPAPQRISVRALNASPDITKVDAFLDDQPLNNGVEYGRPTERQNFAAGQYTVKFYAAGADRSKVEPLTGQVVTLTENDNFDVILLGSASNLSVLAFPENLTPTADGDTRISFLNTLSNLAEVDAHENTNSISNIPPLYFGQAPTVMDVGAGSYWFIMTALNDQGVQATIENAENVQLQAGNSYLYLVTGRANTPPLIISDKVDTTGASSNAVSTPSASEAAKVRFINAVNDQTLDFSINSVSALQSLKYGEGSALIPTTEESASVAVSAAGQTNPLGQEDMTFELGSSYSVVAYKAEGNAIGLLVINDDNLIFDGSSPHLRLINISANNTSTLGLAFSTFDPNITPAPTVAPVPTTLAEATAEATQDGYIPNIPFTLPYGIQKLVNDIAPESASSVILMPTGDFKLQIIDSPTNKLALTLPKVTLDANVHTDVIAYEDENSGAVTAFTIPYPQPQG